MAKPAIVIVKRFTFKNAPEEWSNKYFFSQAAPSTPAAWKTLIDSVIAKEVTVYTAHSHAVRAYGYADGDLDSVYTFDYTAAAAEVAGTLPAVSGQYMQGDGAAWIRWATTKRNTKGKTVYLRKYYHDGQVTAGQADVPITAYLSALNALGQALNGGTGAISGFTICGADGTVAGQHGVSAYITTRTLKRRGKRPPS